MHAHIIYIFDIRRRNIVLLTTAVSLPRIYSTCRSTQCMGNSSSQDMPPPVTVAAQARHTATVSSCFHPMTWLYYLILTNIARWFYSTYESSYDYFGLKLNISKIKNLNKNSLKLLGPFYIQFCARF